MYNEINVVTDAGFGRMNTVTIWGYLIEVYRLNLQHKKKILK